MTTKIGWPDDWTIGPGELFARDEGEVGDDVVGPIGGRAGGFAGGVGAHAGPL